MQFIQQSPVGGRRGGDVRPHEDGVQTDALDVGPRDGQGLVPAQQPEEPGPPQQKQAPDAGRVGVQLHIVHPAKAGPVLCRGGPDHAKGLEKPAPDVLYWAQGHPNFF